MKNRSIILFFFLFFLFGCSKNDELLTTLQEEMIRQEELIKALQNFCQIVRVENKRGRLTISFSNGEKITLVSDFTPILSINENGNWSLNGTDTGILADSDVEDMERVVLEIGDNGNWYINGKDTGQTSLIPGNDKSLSPTILSISIQESALFLYLSDSTVLYVPINQDPMFIVPQYFMNQLVAKEEAVREAMESAGKDQSSFLFFTDAHWGRNQKHSPALIKHFRENTKISKVFFGGDVITTSTTSTKEAMDIGYSFQKAFQFLGSELYCVYGNHDNNSARQEKNTELHLSDAQIYSYLQSQMMGLEVTYWDYFNFYIDQPISKTRFVCIDSGRFYSTVFRSSCIPTIKFVISALSTVPMGWNIIMVGHIWENDYLKVLDNYNLKKTGVYKYADMSVPYDFSNASSTVKFCIGGHLHYDKYWSSPNGIPVMIMTTDSQITSTVEESRTGTIGEQCVTAFVADYQKDSVFLFRVGRGEDARIKMYSPN